MAFDVGSVVAHVKADITDFQDGLKQAQNQASTFGDHITGVADKLQKLVTVGILAAAGVAAIFTKSSIDAAADAEVEMARVDALLRKTTEDMKYSTVTIAGNTGALKDQTKAIDAQIETKQRQLKVLVLSDKADTDEYKNLKKSINALELQKIAIEDTTEVKDKSIKVTNKHALSQAQLRAEVDKTSKAFIQLGFDDEDTATAMAKSLKVTKDLTESQKEMALSADFARLQGIGIADAQRLLQMAYMGNQRVLKQYGIELDDNATKQQIFAAVQAVAGGQAEVYSQTYAGAMARMNVETTNFKETIGAIFLPKLGELMSGISNAVGKVIEWEKNTKTIENTIKGFGDNITKVTTFLKEHETQVGLVVSILTWFFLPALVAVTIQMGINFLTSIANTTLNIIKFGIEGWNAIYMITAKIIQLGIASAAFIFHTAVTIAQTVAQIALTAATWLFNAAMAVLTAPIWLVVAAIVALIAIGVYLITHWDDVKKAASALWKHIQDGWDGLVKWVSDAGGKVLDAIMWPFNEAKRKIEEVVNWIKDKLDFTKRNSPSVVDIVKSGVAKVNDALGDLAFGTTFNANAAGAAVSYGGNQNSSTIVQVSMAGAVITDAFGAGQMGELMGDAIIKRLQQQVRI